MQYDLKTDIYSIFGEKLNENKRQLTEMLKGIINLIRSNENFLKQCASDFLVILMEKIPKHAIKFGKDLIMNYFYDPKFFKNDKLNLHNWSKIISQYALCCPEILNDLLNKIDDKNIFSVKVSESDKIRILRRIGFLIYSCKKDTFKEQFDIVKSKAKDLLSGYSSANNTSNLLEEEIFLIMRILFLRFSHDGVMKMIRDLWPIIFMELTQNITNEERNKDVKLVAESFKFIELLSLANAEEFTLYEWTFIIDTYNMENLDTRIPDSMINKLLNNKNACFKPLAINILSKGKLEVTDELLKGQNKGKSEAYIITKKNTFEELYEGIKKFLYSIVDTNNYKEQLIKEEEEDDTNQNNTINNRTSSLYLSPKNNVSKSFDLKTMKKTTSSINIEPKYEASTAIKLEREKLQKVLEKQEIKVKLQIDYECMIEENRRKNLEKMMEKEKKEEKRRKEKEREIMEKKEREREKMMEKKRKEEEMMKEMEKNRKEEEKKEKQKLKEENERREEEEKERKK